MDWLLVEGLKSESERKKTVYFGLQEESCVRAYVRACGCVCVKTPDRLAERLI